MGKLILKIGYTGTGKQQSVNAIVQTPLGPRKLGDIAVGDMVFARNGKPTKVTGVFPQGVRPSYRITFRDGTSAVAGAEHLWAVQHRTAKKKDVWQVKTTAEILEILEILGRLQVEGAAL
jgi:hypothetical protein